MELWTDGLYISIYLQKKNKLKVLGSTVVAKVYTVTTLLRNFRVALYGSQTSNYFGISWNGEAFYNPI